MTAVRFDRFQLLPAERRLLGDGVQLDLNARYFDALALLVRDPGALVTKDRFLGEVWRGVPVTDEALTQCIKTLRRTLGDDAGRPRFIETVPKHGYRFIAPVEADKVAQISIRSGNWRRTALLGLAGVVGGGLAGALGGLAYGMIGASLPLQPGMGAVSVLLVLVCLTILVALMGSAGVAFGIAAATSRSNRAWAVIAGGALGGFLVGAFVKLLGIDGFNLLFGRSPGDITGGFEGLLLGGAIGLGHWLAGRQLTLRRGVILAGLTTGIAGLLITLLGGRMMGGSLALLAVQFPDSRLRLDRLGALVGETDFGPIAQAISGTLEGALFGAMLVGAMHLARRQLDEAA